MPTYRRLFALAEFRALLLVHALHTAGQTVSALGLGVLVFQSTEAPLAASLALTGPSLAQAAGAVLLLSAADRLPPRAALSGLGLLLAAASAVPAAPGAPLAAILLLLVAAGMAGAVGGGIRYGLLTELIPAEGFVLGRSVLAMSSGLVQTGGFALAGVLAAAGTGRMALGAGAALYAASSVAARVGLVRRAPRSTGRPSAATTLRLNARLWASAPRRRVLLALWLPGGAIVGAESLFVAYDPGHAGLLFACGAAGMLAADAAAGRLLPADLRPRLIVPLLLLLAGPYLVFALHPPVAVAAVAVSVGAFGYASGLLLQERLLALTPPALAGHALGLHAAGLLAFQGAGGLAAGALAQVSAPETGIAGAAATALVAVLLLGKGLSAGPASGDGRGGEAPQGL
ncbi:MFS transporter [Streptomonospora wellingtoniae]|uniref:MFS transporter n=1 Tax=Streptomonospora wellingtoniae TaxID=3075544 RepID=A0ABU2L0E3_9ACTN|nr:MFS transporter [Streptomonospora sp. DSM 45055]MDT0304995.1 MFS transporter [Streptomonospora sp. DSM 45055]